MKRSGPLKRNTPLKPGKPLDRGKPLERGEGLAGSSSLGPGAGLKRSGKLKPRSDKRQRHMDDDRKPLIQELISNDVGCEICPLLDAAEIPHPPCAGIQGMHERRKSGAGGSRVNRRNLMAACNWSNGWIEDEAGLARETFGDLLVVREGDHEWELLGSRLDRM